MKIRQVAKTRLSVRGARMAAEVLTDADVVEVFRATGAGCEQRINDALRVYLLEHPLKAD
ncbi:BrnA antitoxin family protein [Paraburkholderia rhynchosiae]